MSICLELAHLRCPVSGGSLAWMEAARTEALRQAVAEARLVNRAGELVTQVPSAVLECADSGLAYPVLDGIAILVPGEAIALGQLGPIVRDELGEHSDEA